LYDACPAPLNLVIIHKQATASMSSRKFK